MTEDTVTIGNVTEEQVQDAVADWASPKRGALAINEDGRYGIITLSEPEPLRGTWYGIEVSEAEGVGIGDIWKSQEPNVIAPSFNIFMLAAIDAKNRAGDSSDYTNAQTMAHRGAAQAELVGKLFYFDFKSKSFRPKKPQYSQAKLNKILTEIAEEPFRAEPEPDVKETEEGIVVKVELDETPPSTVHVPELD